MAGYYCKDPGTSYANMLLTFCSDGRNCDEGTVDPELDADECERGLVCVDKVNSAVIKIENKSTWFNDE